jgi:hypothetical protein
MTEAHWFRGFVQGKTRIALAWIFSIALILSARNYPHAPGVVLCFVGASIRYWASGFLRKDSRPAVGGPYSFVRNPLYLGTYLMALGTALAVENWWLLGICTVVFAVIYHYIILDEETKLVRIFGEPYTLYCTLVPRFFPRPLPAAKTALASVNPETSHTQFSRELAAKNKAYEAYLTFAALIGFISIAAFAWQRFAS